MRFDIVHTTCYSFSEPVYLEPHTFRFHPRADGSQRPEDFSMLILPRPAGLTQTLDAEGNVNAVAWFNGKHGQLAVTARARVLTLRSNPFDFLVETDGQRLPVRHRGELLTLLAPALARQLPVGEDPVRR